MIDVVERVARAMCVEEYARRELVNPWWGDAASQPADTIRVSGFEKQNYRGLACAAIKAMRDDRHGEIVSAYIQGALDVHEHYEPDIDPDFTEAAHDYAANLATLTQDQPS